MTILTLTAHQDHLEKVARTRDPIKAISEFVWNGLDANATSVEVSFSFNVLGGIESISIVDDGDGITRLRADKDFANLGDSWKKAAARARSQRALHGKEGRGRLRFFSLAQRAIRPPALIASCPLSASKSKLRPSASQRCPMRPNPQTTGPERAWFCRV